MSLAWEPHVEGLALPISVESGNLSFSKTGIRWMSVESGNLGIVIADGAIT
jgi:hypothetical protein